MGTYRDLIVYKKAFALGLKIQELSKRFPAEERFSLTDQVRRSSRSVCANIGEGYRKRRYVAHWISKLTDSDGEATETQIHLDFALAFGYITPEEHAPIFSEYEEIGNLLNDMMEQPYKYGVTRPDTSPRRH